MMSGTQIVTSNPFFGVLIGGMIVLFPLIVAVFTNLFCIRIARELAPREERQGSIVTSPLLYLYFVSVLPITLIIMWFPMGLSLLLMYGEGTSVNLVLPNSMNEQMLVLLFDIFVMTLMVAGFSIRAGELYRYPNADGPRPYENARGFNNLHIPTSMVI